MRTRVWVVFGVVVCCALPLSATAGDEFRFGPRSPLGGGSLAVTAEHFNGLPVVGGGEVARFSERGTLLYSRGQLGRVPEGFSTQPTLSPEEAWQGVQGSGTHELVVDLDPLAGPRLSYRLHSVLSVWPPMAERVFVDAHRGGVYRREPMVWHASKGRLFPENPIKTPDLADVTLPNVEPTEESPMLASDEVVALSCMTPDACKHDESDDSFFYSCDFAFNAEADHDGNYLYDFEGHTAGDDRLAEVSAYYHLTRAYDRVRAMTGMGKLVNERIVAIANYRESAEPLACEGETFVGEEGLVPYDNAAFVPGGLGLFEFPHNGVLIGQGAKIDYAYDGDVLIHEFGHGYHHTVAPELSRGFLDQRGLNPTPGGLMEGYADLVTLALTNDPNIGEYAGVDKPIRVLDNEAKCPEHLTGEMHIDSEIFTGAVYEARKKIAKTSSDRAKFDAAVLASVVGLGAYDGFSEAAASVLQELKAVLGEDAHDDAEVVFTARGLFGCNERVVPAEPKQWLWMTGYFDGGDNPGPLQFKYTLEEDATKIGAIVNYIAPQLGAGELVVVLRKDGPISWSFEDGTLQGDYEQEAEFAPIPDEDTAQMALFEGEFAPGDYHIMFVRRSQGSDVIAGIQFGHAAAKPVEPITRTVSGAETESASGCSSSNSGSWLALGLLLLWLRRRTQISVQW